MLDHTLYIYIGRQAFGLDNLEIQMIECQIIEVLLYFHASNLTDRMVKRTRTGAEENNSQDKSFKTRHYHTGPYTQAEVVSARYAFY